MNKGFLLTIAMTISMLHASEELHFTDVSTSLQNGSIVLDWGGNDKALPRLSLGEGDDRLGLKYQEEAIKIKKAIGGDLNTPIKQWLDAADRLKWVGETAKARLIYEAISSDPNATFGQSLRAAYELCELDEKIEVIQIYKATGSDPNAPLDQRLRAAYKLCELDETATAIEIYEAINRDLHAAHHH